MKKILATLSLMVFASIAMPLFVFAQAPATPVPVGEDGGQGSGRPEQATFQVVPCDNVTVTCDYKALLIGFNRVLKFLLFLSVPLVLGMGLYTAYKFMTAGGDSGKLADAKKMFIPVALGVFWVIAAYTVVYTFIDKLVDPNIQGEAKNAIKMLKE